MDDHHEIRTAIAAVIRKHAAAKAAIGDQRGYLSWDAHRALIADLDQQEREEILQIVRGGAMTPEGGDSSP